MINDYENYGIIYAGGGVQMQVVFIKKFIIVIKNKKPLRRKTNYRQYLNHPNTYKKNYT